MVGILCQEVRLAMTGAVDPMKNKLIAYELYNNMPQQFEAKSSKLSQGLMQKA